MNIAYVTLPFERWKHMLGKIQTLNYYFLKLTFICSWMFVPLQMLELRIWNFLSEFCCFLVFSSGSFSWILNLNAKLLFSELEANISMKSGFCIKYPWEMWSSNWQPDHSCRHLIPFQHTSFLLWSPLLQLTISLFYLTDNFQICLSFFDFSPPLCYFSIFSSSDTFA